MWTAQFWKDTTERVIRTFAQSLLSLLTVGRAITDMNWPDMLSISAGAGVAALLTCLIASGVGDKGTAALVKEEPK